MKKQKKTWPTNDVDLFKTEWNAEKEQIICKKVNMTDAIIFIIMILAIVVAASLKKVPADREILKNMAGNYYLVDGLLDKEDS